MKVQWKKETNESSMEKKIQMEGRRYKKLTDSGFIPTRSLFNVLTQQKIWLTAFFNSVVKYKKCNQLVLIHESFGFGREKNS